eukprot:scaffold865_cov312-Prasinococcus_capsulatus_cf.AAC.11
MRKTFAEAVIQLPAGQGREEASIDRRLATFAHQSAQEFNSAAAAAGKDALTEASVGRPPAPSGNQTWSDEDAGLPSPLLEQAPDDVVLRLGQDVVVVHDHRRLVLRLPQARQLQHVPAAARTPRNSIHSPARTGHGKHTRRADAARGGWRANLHGVPQLGHVDGEHPALLQAREHPRRDGWLVREEEQVEEPLHQRARSAVSSRSPITYPAPTQGCGQADGGEDRPSRPQPGRGWLPRRPAPLASPALLAGQATGPSSPTAATRALSTRSPPPALPAARSASRTC